jgi:beta-glucanase (GH16 family)
MKIVPVLFTLIIVTGITNAQRGSLVKALVATPFNPSCQDTTSWETVLDSNSFTDYTRFEKEWNYLYPWGKDHNGSARMYAGPSDHRYVSLDRKILHIKAVHITGDEGKSKHDPYLNIKYHSAAIHAKHTVMVSEQYPLYEVSGYFKAPVAKGTWPAFWLTAVNGWPPESDILEFKGDSINWQNTFIVPSEANTTKVAVPDAATTWHHYKAVLKKVNATEIDIHYYLDHKLTGVHRCNFMNKPMWIIINLQMEGSSGGPGPVGETNYYIKEVLVKRSRK